MCAKRRAKSGNCIGIWLVAGQKLASCITITLDKHDVTLRRIAYVLVYESMQDVQNLAGHWTGLKLLFERKQKSTIDASRGDPIIIGTDAKSIKLDF